MTAAPGVRQRRAGAGTAIAAAVAVLLAACTTVPTAGPVNEGPGVVTSAPPFVPIPVGPRVDDVPIAIVNGFVNAASAGFASDFTVARQFLVGSAVTGWDPNEQVIVYDSGAIAPTFDPETSTVTYDVPVAATIDDSGRMTEAADGTRETVTFQMAKDSNGQWRISGLDNGSIVATSTFDRLFTQVSLIFASVDETTQVPELRWLPQNKAPTLAARELVEGPSQWLADAVHTGFPATSGLEVDSVVVTDGVATVPLTAQSAGTADERALAEQQMTLTLTNVPGIHSVDVTVGGVPLGADDSAALQPAPLPSTLAAAFIDGRLGAWDGEDLWSVRDGVGSLPGSSTGLAQSFDEPLAAWIVGGDTLVTSDALGAGTSSLEAVAGDEEPPATTMDVTERYTGSQLVAPSIDRHRWVWTADGSGEDGLVAVAADGTAVDIAVDWLRGTTVQALSVSRDGARIAVLSQASGKQVLEVASIVRAADGTPLTIGEPLPAGADLGPSKDLTWVDDLTIGVLGTANGGVPSDLWLVDVGGATTALKTVTDAVDITAREGERSLVVVNAAGQVYVRSGTVWSHVATGPAELAYAG